MTQGRFEQFLKEAIGLDASSIGTSAIMRAVERRTRACNFDHADRYWEYLNQTSSERQALIEAVVVPETWFFRDAEAFTVAAGILRAAWQKRPALPLRVLSLPCSTGEEPYTIAMALLDAQILPSAAQIDGIDISNRSLEQAREGLYRRNSFRGKDLFYRDRHFKPEVEGDGYRISDAVRSMVHFSQGNLFELDHLHDGTFDIIFCRNLLIYFDPADQRRAAARLGRLLSPAGKLFVGHSEASVLLREGFTSLRIPQAFAFDKPGIATARAPAPRAEPLPKQRSAPSAFSSPPRKPLRAGTAAWPMPRPAPDLATSLTSVANTGAAKSGMAKNATVEPFATLEDIRRAANRGELDLALRLGRTLIECGHQSTELFYLLAVISEAMDATETAADYYRRTLYLDPDHHEAVTHLTLMLSRLGDLEGARRMEDRARRLGERKVPK